MAIMSNPIHVVRNYIATRKHKSKKKALQSLSLDYKHNEEEEEADITHTTTTTTAAATAASSVVKNNNMNNNSNGKMSNGNSSHANTCASSTMNASSNNSNGNHTNNTNNNNHDRIPSSSSNQPQPPQQPQQPSNSSSSNDDPNTLLPHYLYPLVRHYHDDFYVSRSFDPRLIVQLMAEGFLPIATRGYLLPKLHVERCVLQLNGGNSNNKGNNKSNNSNNKSSGGSRCCGGSKLHVGKSTRRKSRRFELSVNECFDRVVEGCHRQHGVNWLYPPIVKAFRAIHQRTLSESSSNNNHVHESNNVHNATTTNTTTNTTTATATATSSPTNTTTTTGPGVTAVIMPTNTSLEPTTTTPVRLYSVEIWNTLTGQLSGGELGYSVGGIYSSLTGFSTEDAAGSTQLIALGKLLERCGFDYWDLGMDLEYKRRLGAEMMGRMDFVGVVKRSRVEDRGVVLQIIGNDDNDNDGRRRRVNARELVDWDESAMEVDEEENGGKKKKNDQQQQQQGNNDDQLLLEGVDKKKKKSKRQLKKERKKLQKQHNNRKHPNSQHEHGQDDGQEEDEHNRKRPHEDKEERKRPAHEETEGTEMMERIDDNEMGKEMKEGT